MKKIFILIVLTALIHIDISAQVQLSNKLDIFRVLRMDVSQNNKYLVTLQQTNKVQIWETKTNKQIAHFNAGFLPKTITIDWNGNLIILGGENHKLKIYNIETESFILNERDLGATTHCVAISPDNKYIALGTSTGYVEIWDIATLTLFKSFEAHKKAIYSINFYNSNDKIVTAGEDKTLKVWNYISGSLLYSLKGHKKRILSTSISFDGKYIASGSEDNSIIIWDSENGKIYKQIEEHSAKVLSLSFSPVENVLLRSRSKIISHSNLDKLYNSI